MKRERCDEASGGVLGKRHGALWQGDVIEAFKDAVVLGELGCD